ncbi:MAG: sulfatase-like hydrolase/transferase [Phycisphaerales bacterium]|nr:sulfatase-like hydrolase/transferase [Phycisphaerales bacterium]
MRDNNYWTGFVGKLDLAKHARNFPGGKRMIHGSGASPEHYSYGFCDPYEIQGLMGGVRDDGDIYSDILRSRGYDQIFHRDRRSRIVYPGIVGVSNFSKGKTDLRTITLPDRWLYESCKDTPLPLDCHVDYIIGERAAKWLTDVDTVGPWFLQVNFSAPHDPFDPPSEYAQRYRTVSMPAPIPPDYTGKPAYIGRRFISDSTDGIEFSRRQYCALISLVDDQVGKMLAVLETRKMLENTIVIITSDHGEMLGDFGLYIKHVPYDSAARIPMVIRVLVHSLVKHQHSPNSLTSMQRLPTMRASV